MQIDKLLNGINVLFNAKPAPVEKKPSMIKDMLDRPEGYLLQAYIENEELTIRIQKRRPVKELKGVTDEYV